MSEKETLIAKINNSYWWHVPPDDRMLTKSVANFSRRLLPKLNFMAAQMMSQNV